MWYFNTWQWQVKESNPSVLAWLETWCGEAERAIASGYFDLFPEGTTPWVKHAQADRNRLLVPRGILPRGGPGGGAGLFGL